MTDRQVDSSPSERSQARLTIEHLARLATLAQEDHDRFTRPGGRPEYRARRLAVVLAQGAALHYIDGRTGVKDLDVWTFYAAIPGSRFPADILTTRADFGPSVLGRQLYDLGAATTDRQRRDWLNWSGYTGRRVDLLKRALPAPAGAGIDAVVSVLRGWLADGARVKGANKPSAWHLAQKAVVLATPAEARGQIIWPAN